MGVPLNHPCSVRIFHHKPSILRSPHWWKPLYSSWLTPQFPCWLWTPPGETQRDKQWGDTCFWSRLALEIGDFRKSPWLTWRVAMFERNLQGGWIYILNFIDVTLGFSKEMVLKYFTIPNESLAKILGKSRQVGVAWGFNPSPPFNSATE